MVRPEGFEPPTPKFVAWYSIQMNYGRINNSMNNYPKLTENFKYINLDWEPVASKLLEYTNISENFFDSPWKNAPKEIYKMSEIHELFKPLNLTIDVISFFTSNENRSSIHVDYGKKVRINFPILNCQGSETKFFILKEKKTAIKGMQSNGEIYYSFLEEDCRHVESLFLTQAVVFNGGNPHQVCIDTNKYPRISCTVAFKEDITHLLLNKTG